MFLSFAGVEAQQGPMAVRRPRFAREHEGVRAIVLYIYIYIYSLDGLVRSAPKKNPKNPSPAARSRELSSSL